MRKFNIVKLSIVTTLYHSSAYIKEFYNRVTEAARAITDDYEIVMVNDGSPDDVLSIVVDLSERDYRVKIVDLSRNFGHHKAIMAGLAHSEGERVFLIDCDLEEAPESIAIFHRAFEEALGTVDSISGVQDIRKGGWFERTAGKLFYQLFNSFSGISLEVNPLTIRLMSRRYVDSVLLHQENELFMAGILKITGYRQEKIVIKKNHKGKSTYTLGHKISLMVKAITSFSSSPLKLIFYSGFFMASISFSLGFYLTIRKLLYNDIINSGWTSVMISIWFLGGLLLLGVGTIGIYLAKIYSEVKRRPNYIVRKIYTTKKQC